MDTQGRERHDESIHLSPTAIAGQATFAGCLAVINVARQALRPVLPPSLVFPQNDSTECACLLVFGEQSEGTTFFGGISVPWGIRYHELMVAVPFVRWKGAADRYLFVSGMVCDFWPAIWNGNFYYGFKKRHAPMRWDGDRFSVTDGIHEHSFSATIHRCDQPSGGQLAWIQSAAALPVLGHRDGGLFVQSQFDWDLREAKVEAVSLRVAFGEHFRELPLGEHTASSDDAYLVRGMRWRISWPITRKPIRHD